jgi:hypothetical protein
MDALNVVIVEKVEEKIMNENLTKLRNILNIEEDIDWLFNHTNNYMLIASKTSKIIGYFRGNNPFGFITAFRRYNEEGNNLITKKENMVKTRELVSNIRNNGYGYIQVLGEYDEEIPNTNDYIHVKEISFFVIGFNEEYDNFRNNMIILRDKYNQDSIITGYCKNKNNRPENDDYFIEIILKNGKTLIKDKYSFKSEEDIDNLIQEKIKGESNNYFGHTRIDKKNFILSGAYSYRPNSWLDNQCIPVYINATGIEF